MYVSKSTFAENSLQVLLMQGLCVCCAEGGLECSKKRRHET